jgi:hypothetical protein
MAQKEGEYTHLTNDTDRAMLKAQLMAHLNVNGEAAFGCAAL